MIPRVIHYCWFGGKPLPNDIKKYIESWKKKCPNYEIKRWDESNFDISQNKFCESAYNNKAWAFVSDYARLKIIYEYGGIYLDVDVELLKNLDFLLDDRCFIGTQQFGEFVTTGLGFGAERKNPIVEEMLLKYDSIIFDINEKNKMICPILNNEVLKQHGYKYSDDVICLEDVKVYPKRFFDPYPSGEGEDLMCSDTVSIHHYSASWTSNKQRWKRRLVNIIGDKNILTLKKLFRKHRLDKI